MSEELFTFENRPNRNIVRFSETEEEVTVKTVPVKETKVSVPDKIFKYAKAPKEMVSTFSAGTGIDNTRREPVVTLATLGAISSTILELTFTEKMISPSADYATGFSVTANAIAKTISSGALHTDDTKIRLTLASAGDGIETYTVSYTSVTGDITSNKGAELLTFSSRAVTNTCAGVVDHGTPYVWINSAMPWSIWANTGKTTQITDGTAIQVVEDPNNTGPDLTKHASFDVPTWEDTPYIYFDGGDALQYDGVVSPGTNYIGTIAIVGKWTVAGVIFFLDANGVGWRITLGGGNGLEYIINRNVGGTTTVTGTTSQIDNVKRLLLVSVTANGSNYNVDVRVNGVSETTATAIAAADITVDQVWVCVNPNNGAKPTGTIYELVWVPGGVSNLANFETFMMTRHGL